MSLQLQMFQAETIVDIQNAVNEWINIEETRGLEINYSETTMAFDPNLNHPIIIISVWYETVIEE